MDPIAPANHYAPIKIAEDTFLIQELTGEGRAPVNVYINSLVIRGKEPAIVDTGSHANRAQWLEDVFSLVDPEDVRWVVISHDDVDHTGNLRQVLEACPNATLVGNWFMVERMGAEIALPLHRMRWIDDGGSFDAGDRTFGMVRPPIYDSPTTRGLYDSKTGVYWASDAFAAPVTAHTENAADLDREAWEAGFAHFAQILAPWYAVVDQRKYDQTIDRLAKLDIKTVASGHGPTIHGSQVRDAYGLLSKLPGIEPQPVPGQAELEEIIAMMNAGQLGVVPAGH